ncbi:MAG: ribosome-associated translation inhibitor RaiA [Clostridia bacterium]|nr:ribosome-associated translation inhibitor RaiA [Clostridia bacterium]
MKVNITSKNFNASNHLKETIEKKLEKLGKYFSSEIEANVMLSTEKDRQKIEATIGVKGTIFRAEDVSADAYEGVDKVVEKLSSQMSRFKTKLQKKYKDNKEFMFADIPEVDDEPDEIRVVRTKKFELVPMNVDEAIMQMELLGHTFFVFLNMETDSVNVVYERKNGDYGLLETTY